MCAIMIGLLFRFCVIEKSLSEMQLLPIQKRDFFFKRKYSPQNTTASNKKKKKKAMLCFWVHFVVCRQISLIFAKCKWDVKIFPAQLQHSLTAEHNSAIWNINHECQVLITVPQNESSRIYIDRVKNIEGSREDSWTCLTGKELFLFPTIPIFSTFFALETPDWRPSI